MLAHKTQAVNDDSENRRPSNCIKSEKGIYPEATNQGVVGSNPAGRAKFLKGLSSAGTTPYLPVGTSNAEVASSSDRRVAQTRTPGSQLRLKYFAAPSRAAPS